MSHIACAVHCIPEKQKVLHMAKHHIKDEKFRGTTFITLLYLQN